MRLPGALALALLAGCVHGNPPDRARGGEAATQPSSSSILAALDALAVLNPAPGQVPSRTGKVVLVDFWASWCEPCRQSLPFYQRLQNELAARGFQVVAVSIDESAEEARQLASELNLTVPILWDSDARLTKSLGIRVMPTALLLDREGAQRFRHDGYVEGDDVKLRAEVERLLGTTQGRQLLKTKSLVAACF
jgi:thiol-disulfide isomerase/thioredoxin